MTVRQQILIKCPVSEVFMYATNVENRTQYISSLDKVIMLDPLPINKGSRYIEVANIAGRKIKTTYQVIEYVRNERIAAKTIKSVFPIRADLKFISVGTSTKLSLELNFQLRGIFKLASGIVKGIVEQQAKDILKRLKGNLELSK